MARTVENLINRKFGKLTVLARSNQNPGSAVWKCQCACSNKTIIDVRAGNLKSGNTKSCGCLQKEKLSARRYKHGACKTKSKEGQTQLDYSIWAGMIQRCCNTRCPKYKDYGARGIKVFIKWRKDFKIYADYIRTLPGCPSDSVLKSRLKGKRLKVSIDRINNNKDYKPGNIRWSSKIEQANNKTTNVIVTLRGKKMNIVQACEKYGVSIDRKTIRRRLRDGWSTEDAFFSSAKQ